MIFVSDVVVTRRGEEGAYRVYVRWALSFFLLLTGCLNAHSVDESVVVPSPRRVEATTEVATQAAPLTDLLVSSAPKPLGFERFVVTPTPPVEWADVLRAEAELLPGCSELTDVTYRWFVSGRVVRGWKREFLRHEEGRWRKGDRVGVYAVADDGTGRISRTEEVSILIGEKRRRPAPPPPVDWDALRAEEERVRRMENEDRAADALRAERNAPTSPDPSSTAAGQSGYYLNPMLSGEWFDPRLVPEPRRGITTGSDQKVDGWTPGEPRVDGYTPGEQRVDGWSPGEPRVGR